MEDRQNFLLTCNLHTYIVNVNNNEIAIEKVMAATIAFFYSLLLYRSKT
jgi:hypothetical protein